MVNNFYMLHIDSGDRVMVVILENIVGRLEKDSMALLEGDRKDRSKAFKMGVKWGKIIKIIKFQGGNINE